MHGRDRQASRPSRRAFLGGAVRAGVGLGALPLLGACAGNVAPAAAPAGSTAAPAAGPTAVPTPRPPREIVFATSAGGSAMGLITAVVKRHRLDEKHGLNLDLKPFDPADAEKALLIGVVEVGFFVPISWALVNHEGQDVSFIAPLHTNHSGLLVRTDAPYQTMADLRGKRISTPGAISGLYTSMQVLMRENNLDWERDFELVSGPAPAVIAALERGDVEAALPFEPNTSRLLASGQYRELLNPSDAWQQRTGSPMFMVGLAARQSWIDQNRDAARAVKAALLEATRYIRERPEVFEEERELLGIASDAHLALVKQRMGRIYLPEQDAGLVRTADQIVTRAVELGIVPDRPRKDIFATL